MTVVTIRSGSGDTEASIRPDLGFNCFRLTASVAGQPVNIIDSADDFGPNGGRPSGNGIPILFPYPNRIAAGQFAWNGDSYTLPDGTVGYDAIGNAIHGFCHDRPWRVVAQSDDSVTGEFQFSIDCPDRLAHWPGDLRIRATCSVTDGRFTTLFEIHNPGSTAVPWGLGTHPYFRVPFAPADKGGSSILEAPASEEWGLSDLLPDGRIEPVSPGADLRDGKSLEELSLDHVLTGVGPAGKPWRCSIMNPEAGVVVTQTASPEFGHLVVFTPPGREAVCFEPYTCVTNAINMTESETPHGLRVLESGESCTCGVDITVGQVLA